MYNHGSAFTATADIYSLKDQIEQWGEGTLLIENDSHVRLARPRLREVFEVQSGRVWEVPMTAASASPKWVARAVVSLRAAVVASAGMLGAAASDVGTNGSRRRRIMDRWLGVATLMEESLCTGCYHAVVNTGIQPGPRTVEEKRAMSYRPVPLQDKAFRLLGVCP